MSSPEDALRDENLRVVRWTWDELDHFDPVAERLRRASGDPGRTSQHVE